MSNTKWYQTPVHVLVALALALLAGIPFMPQAAASPDQATFYSSASDGCLESPRGPDYSNVHGNSTAGNLWDNVIWLGVGQKKVPQPYGPPHFWIQRSALFFDTSSLPDDATISSAVLSLYGYVDGSLVDFDITVVDGSVLDEPLVAVDYGALKDQTVSGGAFNTSGFTNSTYNDIPLNGTGMGWISKTGITKLGLRSSRDIVPTVPPSEEWVTVYASEKGEGYQPKLVVTYTTPPPPPAVPAMNHWGIIVMVALFAGLLVWTVLRRRPAL